MKDDDKKRMRQFFERLFDDRPELRDKMIAGLDDTRFSCHDWMLEAGYTQEQRLIVLRLSSDVLRMSAEHYETRPVAEWSAKDWERYERFQWDCTTWFRSLLTEHFTLEQADAVTEAWEHERYVCHSLNDGYGRMHHCRFCAETAQ